MKKALLYLFYFILVVFVVQWAVYSVWMLVSGNSVADVLRTFGGGNPDAITPSMMVLASALWCAAVIALFAWRRFAPMSPTYLRTRPWDVFFWCAVAAVGTILPSSWLQELLPSLPDTSGDVLEAMKGNRYGYFVLGLLVPFAEEAVFRGAMLRSLLGSLRSHWAAIALSAVLFALVHVNPAQMPHAFLMGLFLGWMYYRTGSILPGVVLHCVNNTVVYSVCTLFPYTTNMSLKELFGGNTNSMVLSFVFSLFILLPAIYQLNVNMKRAKNSQE